MQKLQSGRTQFQSCVLAFFSGLIFSFAAIASADTLNTSLLLGNDDEEFFFMGRCPHGEMYRIKAYQKWVDGATQSFYDYEGPAGKGTVQTKTSPKIFVVRVCRQLAEIRNDF